MSSFSEQSPKKIEHFVDTDLNPKTGEFSYYYNYLVYTFEHADGAVTARSYLDEPSEVSIIQCPVTTNLEEELAGILTFLRYRYQTIQRLGSNGYTKI